MCTVSGTCTSVYVRRLIKIGLWSFIITTICVDHLLAILTDAEVVWVSRVECQRVALPAVVPSHAHVQAGTRPVPVVAHRVVAIAVTL